jgi:ATP-dependent exoDNAse (exonuclease V) beta subunit
VPKNFVVYKSSAGSGKTFTLVKEYLKLALANEHQIQINYKRILALTFTNKAAAEMRIRIVNALIQICEPNTHIPLEETLCKELAINEVILKERAQKLINYLLHHYSDFAVSTIDSFSHKIVKTFAHDLKLPVNFNLETDTKEFYNKVVSQLISEIGSDKEITFLLKEFALNNLDENLSWDPEKNMQEFAKILQQEGSIEHIQHLSSLNEAELEKMKLTLQNKIKDFKNYIVSHGQKALDLIDQHHLKEVDFTGKSRGPQNYFKKCVEFDLDPEDKNATLLKAIENNKWAANDASADVKNKIESITSQLNQIATDLLDYYKNNFSKYKLYQLLNKRIYPILLLKKIQSITNQIKEDEQLVFIEEFNSKIFEFIKNEPVSFIYERLGDRYKHFLIDEFQDTSTLQWQNILPLVENSLADGHFNLLVGDGKQSIYRWRNANVRQFAILPKLENAANSAIIQQQENALVRNYDERVLKTNYRSFTTIIEFNNALFDHLSKTYLTEPLNGIYDHQEQNVINRSIGKVTIVNDPKEKEQLNDFVCGKTLKYINDALNNGFEYKDICIISSSNKNGSLIANFLNEQQIPVISNDSLLLSNSAEVNTLCAFLKYIQNSKDHVSATVVIHYLLDQKAITLEQFHSAVINLAKKDLYFILDQLGFSISENEIQSKNLLDIAVYLIAVLKLNNNVSANIYLRFFLDEISKYMSTKNSNISEFNTWWLKRSEKSSLIISENLNAVKIMTIHGSKGLEFPVVIVPFCNWETNKIREQWLELKEEELPIQSAYLPMNKQTTAAGFTEEVNKETQEVTLDNINMLYVAFTRAVEQLHIISSANNNQKNPGVNKWLNDFIDQSSIFTKVEDEYVFGETVIKKQNKQSVNTVIQLKEQEWRSTIEAVKIKGSFLKNSEITEHAKQKGILIHYILSKIKLRSDIDHALTSTLIEGTITAQEKSELKTVLTKLLEIPTLKPYFTNAYQSKIERELLNNTGDILRPDRIAFSENEVCIIDYKTGQENTKKYNKQMLEYDQAIRKMGYTNIKKLIVYIEEFKVIEVY